MEHGEGSQSGHGNPRSSSGEQQQQQQWYSAGQENSRDQDYYMPAANITRLMRQILPLHAKIADDAKEMVQRCITEYINLVTSDANDRCCLEERRTITADDIICAMDRLGFENYTTPLRLFLDRYREAQREEKAEGDGESEPPHSGSSTPGFSWLPRPPTYGRAEFPVAALVYEMGGGGAGSCSSTTSQGGEGPSHGTYDLFKN